jgi:preprotein translocase YajC subunit
MAQPAFVIFLTILLPISVGPSLHGQENSTPTIGGVEPTSVAESGVAVSEAQDNAPPNAEAVSPAEKVAASVMESSPGTMATVKPLKKLTLTEELISNPLNYLLLLIVCVYVYLLFLRPNAGRKESREQIEKLKNLKKNDRVVTTAGIHGIISNINSEAGTITLRVDENTNTKLTVDRLSIRSVVP